MNTNKQNPNYPAQGKDKSAQGDQASQRHSSGKQASGQEHKQAGHELQGQQKSMDQGHQVEMAGAKAGREGRTGQRPGQGDRPAKRETGEEE